MIQSSLKSTSLDDPTSNKVVKSQSSLLTFVINHLCSMIQQPPGRNDGEEQYYKAAESMRYELKGTHNIEGNDDKIFDKQIKKAFWNELIVNLNARLPNNERNRTSSCKGYYRLEAHSLLLSDSEKLGVMARRGSKNGDILYSC